MIELETSRSYHRNAARCSGDAAPCAVCGRAVKQTDDTAWVRLFYGSTVVTPAEAEAIIAREGERGDLGCYPVGPDCLRRHPELEPYVQRWAEVQPEPTPEPLPLPPAEVAEVADVLGQSDAAVEQWQAARRVNTVSELSQVASAGCDCGECARCRMPLLDQLSEEERVAGLVAQAARQGDIPADLEIVCPDCGEVSCQCDSEPASEPDPVVERLERKVVAQRQRIAALEAAQAALRERALEVLRVYDNEALEEAGAGSEALFAAMVQLQTALSADDPGASLAAQAGERAALEAAHAALRERVVEALRAYDQHDFSDYGVSDALYEAMERLQAQVFPAASDRPSPDQAGQQCEVERLRQRVAVLEAEKAALIAGVDRIEAALRPTGRLLSELRQQGLLSEEQPQVGAEGGSDARA